MLEFGPRKKSALRNVQELLARNSELNKFIHSPDEAEFALGCRPKKMTQFSDKSPPLPGDNFLRLDKS